MKNFRALPLGVVVVCCVIVLPFRLPVLYAQEAVGALLTGSRELKSGDKGFIAWRFQGFESVKIVGDTLSVIRGARDMITIAPTKTTVYKITALGQKGNRLDTLWRVVVLTEAQADSIAKIEANSAPPETASRGGAPPDAEAALPQSVYAVSEASTKPSRYYAGIARSNSIAVEKAKLLKIVRIPDNSVEGSFFHAVILDELGNFLPTFSAQSAAFQLTLLGASDTSAVAATSAAEGRLPSLTTDAPFRIREASLYDSPDLAVTLCLDNAGYMRSFASLSLLCQDFTRSLGTRVEQHRIYFDHRISLNEPLPRGENAVGGLTALYKAAYKGVLTLKQSGRRHKALVLISGGKDDASILYTMQDVMRSAREFGVVVYAIAIGSNADTYALRNIADYTGGRFYAIEDEKSEELAAVLKEISMSYKAFYEIALTAGTSVQAHSKAIDATLAFKTGDGRTLSETKPFALNEQAYYSAHQILATFAANSFEPDEQFDSQIGALAQVLKDNPTKVIELVGHTDMQGNDGMNRSFALKRAQSVKARLSAMGANPAQIRLRSVGREKPVYYFESAEWQARVNRRVELRWLDPALVPYEIVAEAVSSEEEAMRLEAQWSARGYDAYYDPFLVNRIPAYRLKLWGFPTYESAVKAKDALVAKYRITLKVQ